MNCLIDQGLPRTLAIRLRESGWDAIHVGEINWSQAEDSEILKRAEEEKRVVLTLDSDFHQLLALSGASQPSVVRFRDEGLSIDQYVNLLVQVESHLQLNTSKGSVSSVHQGRVRIRNLPLSQSNIDHD